VIPLLLVVIAVYQVQISKKNWSVVLGGLALWGCDWFNEIWNGLVFNFKKFAPAWDAPWGRYSLSDSHRAQYRDPLHVCHHGCGSHTGVA
jgi:hypothetical protein